jgi:hypothetical protein
MAKILVGTVTSNIKDYCWNTFKKQLLALQEKGCDVLIVDNSVNIRNRPPFKTIHYTKTLELQKKHQGTGRNHLTLVTRDCMNILREEFLKGDYTHLFILESDVFLDKSLESLDKLLEMDSDVANFTYPMNLDRFEGFSLCVQSRDANDVARMITPKDSEDLYNTGVKVLGVDTLNGKTLSHCGYGCTLVKRRVLEQIEFKAVITPDGKFPYPDSMFHEEVWQKKFTNKLDTSWLPYHANLNGETKAQLQIVNIQNKTTRKQRREAQRNFKKNKRAKATNK